MSQMCITALANLHRAALKDNKPKQLFSKDQDILPYIEQHWEAMTTMPRRVTQSWYDWNCLFEHKNCSLIIYYVLAHTFRYATVQRAMVKDIHTVFAFEESEEKGQSFGLVSMDFSQIKPNYEAMVKGGTLRITDDGYTQGLNKCVNQTFPALILRIFRPHSKPRQGRSPKQAQIARQRIGTRRQKGTPSTGHHGRRKAAGTRLSTGASVQQGRLSVHSGRTGSACAVPPGV